MSSYWIAACLLVVIGVIGVFSWARNKEETQRRRELEIAENKRLNEESVIRSQVEFEKQFESEIDMRLPDAIPGKAAYIYRNLMRKWYSALIAKCRYDEAMARKIKSDWLSYMSLLRSYHTSSFLFMETEQQKKRDAYGQAASEEHEALLAIEDAFARASGDGAVEELHVLREKDHDAFDYTGRKEIAPIGFHYFPVSINPYIEELVKDQ